MESRNPPLHILLVDDNSDDRAMVRSHLRSASSQRYIFTEFSTGAEVFDYLKQAQDAYPDCMILDIHMPHMDGTRTLQAIKTHFGIIPLPAIVLTGSGSEEEEEFGKAREAIYLGAQDFLAKNFLQPQFLLRSVYNAIERFRLVQTLEEQKDRFRLATEAASLGTWGFEPNIGAFTCSGRCRKMLSMPEGQEIDYNYFLDRIHEDDRETMRDLIDSTLASAHPKDFRAEYRIALEDSEVRWISARGRTFKTAQGQPRLLGTMLDISERKRVDAEKSSLQKEFDRFFSIGIDLMMVGDYDGKILQVNPAWTKTLGWTPRELLNGNWWDLIHPDDTARSADMAEDVFAKPSVWEIENRFRHKDGSWRWLHWRAESFPGERRWYGAATDVTQRKEAEHALLVSTERLNMALESSQIIGTWDWDVANNLVYADARFARRFNVDPDAARHGVPIAEFTRAIHSEDFDHVSAAIERALATGENFQEEYRLIQQDGSTLWVQARGQAKMDAANHPTRFPGMAFDITEARKATRALQQNEQRLRALTEVMPQLIWACLAHGPCDYLSRQWGEYTGIDESTLLGFAWLEVLHPDDRILAQQAWEEAVAGRATYDLEFRILRADGQYRWFKTRGVPVRDERGNVTHWYGTCTDIEDQKRNETALVEARNHAEAANIAKSEFLANMSHEIRTPMNAVIGLANILAISAPLSPKQRDFIRTLQLSADSLLELINDLLDIAKIEARTVDLESIPFSLEQLMQELASMMSVRAKQKNLAFTVEGDCIKGRRFVGDPTRLRQILMNLCSNALKFTEHGGVTLHVGCGALENAQSQLITIAVRDTGIGIANDKLASIFEKFVQADSSINRKYGGTGLGLAITKTLIEIMGGAIAVQSVPDAGSTFTVSLPMIVSASQLETVEPHQEIEPAFQDEPLRPRVLLVEDYAPNVLVATTFLEQFGFDYDTASNGLEALDQTQARRYIAILMDVQMHGMNGFEATEKIRAREAKTFALRQPIIGMTAHALAGDRERCIAAGMDDYIAKPFNPEELRRKLMHYVEADSHA